MLSHVSLSGIDAAAKLVFEVSYDSLNNTPDVDAMNEVELIEGWVKLVDTTATDTVALPHQFEAVLRNAYQKMTSEYIAGNISPATAFYVATVYSYIPSLFNELDGEPIYAALRRLLESVCEPVAA